MIIASVRHTGTQFLRNLTGLKNIHFGEKFMHRADGHYVITPIRRVNAIIQSWARRDLDLEQLHSDIGDMIEYPVDFVIPIDSDQRDDYLKELSSLLGEDLKTDWTPQGNEKISAPGWTIDRHWFDRIHEDYGDWFDQYYGRNR